MTVSSDRNQGDVNSFAEAIDKIKQDLKDVTARSIKIELLGGIHTVPPDSPWVLDPASLPLSTDSILHSTANTNSSRDTTTVGARKRSRR